MDTVAALSFGTLLRRHRIAAGLTQEELAERAGVSQRSISDLERGVPHRPHKDTVNRLARALALAPPEQVALAQAVRRVGAAPASAAVGPGPAAPPFVGRIRELALLEQHLGGEGPPLLLLAGEPGIGKTRLLQAAIPRAVGQGLQVLQGGCQRRGGHEPYAPLQGALQRHLHGQPPAQVRRELRGCAWLVRLLPELASGPIEPLPAPGLAPEHARRLMFAAVARYLGNVAGPAGVLLLLDDLQWAGADALDLLSALVRVAAEVPLRLVGTYRDTEVPASEPLAVLLADLAHAGLATRRALAPLASLEAAQLLDDLLPGGEAVDRDLRARVVQRTGGVPYFLVSCAAALRQREEVAGADSVPWDVAHSVRQRVAALPEAAQELLGAAAVAGRVVPRAVLLAVAGGPGDVVLVGLEAACRAHVLEEEGPDAYRFAHDVVREAVEADLSTARRAALHRQVADALEAQPGAPPVEALAYHYAHSDARDKAVLYLEQAGDQARDRYANTAAVEYYRALVERLDQLRRDVDAAYAREKLATMLDTMAQYDAALALLEQATKACQAAGDLQGHQRILAAIGRVHAHRGTPEEGLRRLRPLVEPQALTAAPQFRGPGLAALYTALAHLCYMGGHDAEHLEAAEQAVALARTAGDERLLAAAQFERGVALTQRSGVALTARSVAEALPALEEASRLAEAVGDLDTLCYALDVMGCAYENSGAFEPARHYTERALAAAERQGDPALLVYLRTRRGMSAFLHGAWDQAHADYAQALTLSRHVGDSWAAPFPLHDLGRLCLAEGAWAEAATYLEESCALAIRSGNLVPLRWAQLVLAERDVLNGQPEAARGRLKPLLDRPGLEEQQVVYLLPTLAWAHLEGGDAGQAATVVEQAVRRARAGRYLRALVEALRVQVLVCTQQHRWAQAAHSVEEGLSLTRRMPYPYAEARLLAACGQMLVAQREPGSARERLEAALATFRQLGARTDVERVEQAIAALSQDRVSLAVGSLSHKRSAQAAATVVTEAQWAQIQELLRPSRSGPGRPRVDDRRTLEAILYVQRTGCPWSALPVEFGDDATAHRRWQRWQVEGTWAAICQILGLPAAPTGAQGQY